MNDEGIMLGVEETYTLKKFDGDLTEEEQASATPVEVITVKFVDGQFVEQHVWKEE